MNAWTYGVAVSRVGKDHVVSVRDLPEVVTSGNTLAEALGLAADAIKVIVVGRMKDGDDLPEPSPIRRGEHPVSLPAQLAAKASVYSAWKEAKLSKSELARRVGRSDTEVARILDPKYGTKLDQLEEAARALGKRLVVTLEPA